MNRRQTGAAVAVAFLCAGILVLFTDVEVGFVRWFNCGPIATESEQNSECAAELSKDEFIHWQLRRRSASEPPSPPLASVHPGLDNASLREGASRRGGSSLPR